MGLYEMIKRIFPPKNEALNNNKEKLVSDDSKENVSDKSAPLNKTDAVDRDTLQSLENEMIVEARVLADKGYSNGQLDYLISQVEAGDPVLLPCNLSEEVVNFLFCVKDLKEVGHTGDEISSIIHKAKDDPIYEQMTDDLRQADENYAAGFTPEAELEEVADFDVDIEP